MAAAKYCGSCGTEVEGSGHFCGSCGASVSTGSSAHDAQAASQPVTRRSAMVALIAVGAVAAIALLGGAFLLLSGNGGEPESAAVGVEVSTASTTVSAPMSATTTLAAVAVTEPNTSTTPTTAPGTTTTVGSTTTTVVAPTTTLAARQPIAVPNGDPATCTVRVGSGGPLATIESTARGFDVALALDLVERVVGPTEVCFIPLTAADRFVALESGEIDLLVRGTSASVSRDELGDFTGAYLLDGLSIAVDASIDVPADLAGLSVATLSGTTSSATLAEQTAATVVEYQDVDAASAAFRAGTTSAIASDWSQLWVRYGSDPDIELIYLGLAVEPISVFVRDGNTQLRDRLEAGLRDMIDEGTWREIFVAEFGVEPWYDPAILASLPPADR